MGERRGFSILIVPHERGRIRTVKVTARAARALVVLGVLVGAGALAGVLSYGRLARRALRADALARENAELAVKVQAVAALQGEVERVEGAYRKIREMLGADVKIPDLPPPGPGDGSPGEEVGGAASTASEAVASGEGEETGGQSRPHGWPLAGRGFITHRHAFLASGHPGIDIAISPGTPVRATADGVVLEAQWDDVYGNFILLGHEGGYRTLYGHNSQVLVSRGDSVRFEQTIALSGNTGRSTAPHLHYEVRQGEAILDPERFLR